MIDTPVTRTPMAYRADIQHLRGIAVLLVVIYHIWPDFLPSGYIGVDIFFVISGFLMRALYLKGDPSKPAYLQFYTRRFLRIVPAYVVTITVFLLYASYALVPYEFLMTQLQALASLMLVPNIYFWGGEAYFDEFEFRPLLHLWSIGVEVQFYILVPLVFYLIRKNWLVFFAAMSISFAACLMILDISSKTAFFMLPFRLWEFFIGFAVAHYLSDGGNVKYDKPVLKWISLLLAGLLLLSGFADTSPARHPGLFALWACMATGFIIAFGFPRQINIYAVVRMPFYAMERLGKYSYSLYLVHYPVIVAVYSNAFSYRKIEAGLDMRLLVLTALIVSLTWVLHHYVETLNWKKLLVSRPIPKSISIVAGLLFCSTLSAQVNNYSFDDYEEAITMAPLDRPDWRCGKWVKLMSILDEDVQTCLLNPEVQSENSRKALLVGDSHADALKMSLAKVLSDADTQLYFMITSCNVGRRGCSPDSIMSIVSALSVDTIYLHDKAGNLKIKGVVKLQEKAVKEGVEIVYIEPVPVYKTSVPAYLYSRHKHGKSDPDFEWDRDHFLDEYEDVYETLDKLNIRRLPTLDYLCTPQCLLSKGAVSYYSDSHHLSLSGAALLEPMFAASLQEKSAEQKGN